MCDGCAAELTAALRAEANDLLQQADKAAATPTLRVHADTLRRQSVGLCYAVGWIREYARRQRVGA